MRQPPQVVERNAEGECSAEQREQINTLAFAEADKTRTLKEYATRNPQTVVIEANPAMTAGSLLIETLFSLDGLGLLSYEAVLKRDYPVIQGVALLVATMFILVNLIIDVLYGVIDPRIRLT